MKGLLNLRGPYLLHLKSIQIKIAFWAGLCLVVTAASIITYAALSVRRTAIEAARKQTMAEARSHASSIEKRVEVGLDAARTLAQTLSGIKDRNHPLELNRSQVNLILREVLEDNPDVFAIYTGWEPDAFDGQDSEYAGTPGHDATGRFIPYWHRHNDGSIHLSPLESYDKQGVGNFYLCPESTQEECVIDPLVYSVHGQDRLLTALVVPIMNQGQFYGIVGVDFRLDFLQQWAEQAQIFDGAGTLALISHDGTLAGVTGQPDLVGAYAEAIHPEFETEHLARIQAGEHFFHTHEGGILETFVPVSFGQTTTPWSANISVPYETIFARANRLVRDLVAIGGGLTLLALIALVFLAQQIAWPIRKVTSIAREATSGNLDVSANVRSQDETGVLAEAFNTMIGSLRQKIADERRASDEATRKSQDIEQARARVEAVVADYLHFVERVAHGDLTVQLALEDVEPEGEGESNAPSGVDARLRHLGTHLNGMVLSLREMTRQIQQASTDIASSAAEILSTTTQQASGAAEQSSALQQTSTTIEEFRSTAQQTTQQATLVAQESQAALVIAQRGSRAVEGTIQGMQEIRQHVETIAQTILELVEQVRAIDGIITTVSEISDQSNLLALNAAIEAARAGEQGKSFGIVAQQVRDLADRSKAATRQIQEILGEIERATSAAVMVTEQGTQGMEQGVTLANEAGKVIRQISQEVENGSRSNIQIASAARQQKAGVDQVVQAIHAIRQATTQTLDSTRQAEQAAWNLSQLAQSLQEAIAVYRIE